MSLATRILSIIVILAATNSSVSHAGLLELDDVFTPVGEPGIYIQGNTAASFLQLESGGYNDRGDFFNTGDSQSGAIGLGGAIGTYKHYERFRLRLEAEGMWRGDSTDITNSYPVPPPFFYHVQSEQNWSAMANLWFDVPLRDRLSVYAGGGIGAAGTHLTVYDTEVFGQGSNVNFAYQLGTGLILPVGENVELDLGYRFLDAGQASVALYDPTPVGNYTADLTSHQIMFSVRLKLR